jgi:3-oxoacyl-[acyl-carrier-protein] synthase III
MRIAAVEHTLPSRIVTNERIIRQVREHNRERLPASELARIEDTIDAYLTAAGTETRYELGDDERAIDFVLEASRRALVAADVSPNDVDFLIYAGVGRGWIEPAMACAVQAELGLRNATCFDIMDACASWLRALHVAYSFIRAGTYRRGLIVNCECGLYRHHAAWRFRSHDDLIHRLAMFTIGEAATATLLEADAVERDYYFTFQTVADHYRLCMVPLPGVDAFRAAVEDRLALDVLLAVA